MSRCVPLLALIFLQTLVLVVCCCITSFSKCDNIARPDWTEYYIRYVYFSCAQCLPPQVLLEHGKFMPGLVEALVGTAIGDTRTVDVTFPQRTAGPGAALAGTRVLIFLVLYCWVWLGKV
jgi:hypothetical protein